MLMAVNLLYSHYTHNVLQSNIINSFPFLHYGFQILIFASGWMAIIGFVAISYIITRHMSGKWPYPFCE